MRAMIRIIAFAAILAPLAWTTACIAQEDAPYIQQQDLVIAESHGLGVPVDVFKPRGDRNGRAIIDVASGAWYSDRGKIRDHQRARFYDILCGRGYTVVAVRPGSQTRFDADDMVSNIEAAIRWVRERAGEFGVDPERLGLTGASAGGHLATLTALRTSRPGSPNETRIAAVAVFFPPTDFVEFNGRAVDPRSDNLIDQIARRLAFREGIEGLDEARIRGRLEAISPARQAHSEAPPCLLIHGDADTLVPLEQSQKLHDALEAAGVPVQLIIKPGGGHPWPTISEEVERLADWFDEQLDAR